MLEGAAAKMFAGAAPPNLSPQTSGSLTPLAAAAKLSEVRPAPLTPHALPA